MGGMNFGDGNNFSVGGRKQPSEDTSTDISSTTSANNTSFTGALEIVNTAAQPEGMDIPNFSGEMPEGFDPSTFGGGEMPEGFDLSAVAGEIPDLSSSGNQSNVDGDLSETENAGNNDGAVSSPFSDSANGDMANKNNFKGDFSNMIVGNGSMGSTSSQTNNLITYAVCFGILFVALISMTLYRRKNIKK